MSIACGRSAIKSMRYGPICLWPIYYNGEENPSTKHLVPNMGHESMPSWTHVRPILNSIFLAGGLIHEWSRTLSFLHCYTSIVDLHLETVPEKARTFDNSTRYFLACLLQVFQDVDHSQLRKSKKANRLSYHLLTMILCPQRKQKPLEDHNVKMQYWENWTAKSKKLTRTLLIFSLIILCKIIGWVRYFSYALSSESQLGVLTFPFIIRSIVLTSAIMSMVCEWSAFESMRYEPIWLWTMYIVVKKNIPVLQLDVVVFQ